jgi:uncharacterized OsmC-like protein
MRIVLESDDELVALPTEEPVTIHAHSPELSYSAFHMLASGLATCVLSVLHTWASNAGLPTENLAVRVKWKFVEDPHRVGSYELTLHWPDLPPDRVAAAERVTEQCAVHETFAHPPHITVSFSDNGQPATGNRKP